MLILHFCSTMQPFEWKSLKDNFRKPFYWLIFSTFDDIFL